MISHFISIALVVEMVVYHSNAFIALVGLYVHYGVRLTNSNNGRTLNKLLFMIFEA